jgi:very-short-patch-repair endonuclease
MRVVMVNTTHVGGGIMSTDPWLKRAAVLTARDLRKNMTASEAVLWERLRDRRLEGMKFCRQHPIEVEIDGRELFIVADFFCHSQRLVIEVDGSSHQGRQQQDNARTDALELIGLNVMRFTNAEVLHELDSVLQTIRGCTTPQGNNAQPEPDRIPLPLEGGGPRG